MDIQFEKYDAKLEPWQSKPGYKNNGLENSSAWMERQILSPYQLKFMLLGMTKDELDEVRRNLSVRNASALKKAKLVARLLDVIPEQAKEIFECFDEERYELVQKLIKSGGIIYEPHIAHNMAKYLQKYGLVFIGNHKGRKAMMMPEEIVGAFKQTACPELSRKVKRNSQWIRLTKGMLFYYGVLDFSEAKNRLERLTGERINTLEFVNVISSAASCYDQMKPTLSGIAQRRALNPEAIKKKRQARTDIEYYPVTSEQLLKAAQPDYVEQTAAVRDFTQFLCEDIKIAPEAVNRIVRNSLDIINQDGLIEDLLGYIERCLELESPQFIELLTRRIQALFHCTRRWTLKGHTLDEVDRDKARFPGMYSVHKENNIIDLRIGKKARKKICFSAAAEKC